MKKVIAIIAAVIVTVLVIALMGVLIGSLGMQSSLKPTEFEFSEWVSEDGNFRLTVGEYDKDIYQCRAELVYYGEQGTYTYTVADAPYGVLGIYISESDIDEWLRVKCTEDHFTVRINRTASLHYSDAYEKSAKIDFVRVR